MDNSKNVTPETYTVNINKPLIVHGSRHPTPATPATATRMVLPGRANNDTVGLSLPAKSPGYPWKKKGGSKKRTRRHKKQLKKTLRKYLKGGEKPNITSPLVTTPTPKKQPASGNEISQNEYNAFVKAWSHKPVTHTITEEQQKQINEYKNVYNKWLNELKTKNLSKKNYMKELNKYPHPNGYTAQIIAPKGTLYNKIGGPPIINDYYSN